MKACVYDLETTDLSAVGSGVLLCAVVKPHGGEPVTLRSDELRCRPGKEGRLVKAVIAELSKYDLWIGQNIDKFDVDYLKSRAYILDVPYDLRPFTYDVRVAFKHLGYRTPMNYFGHPSASLKHIVDFLGIKQLKTIIGMPRSQWETIWETGEKRKVAMDFIAEHCVADVAMTEEVYDEVMPLDLRYQIKRRL